MIISLSGEEGLVFGKHSSYWLSVSKREPASGYVEKEVRPEIG